MTELIDTKINNNDNMIKEKLKGKEIENMKIITIIEDKEIIFNESKYHKKLKKFLKRFTLFIIFFLGYLLYFLSLEGCDKGEGKCSIYIDWIELKVKEEVLSCFIMTLLLQLMFFKIVPKIHSIHFIIIFIFYFNYSHGMTFDDHGFFNFVFYFIIVGLINSILFPFDLIICCFKAKKRIIIIILIYIVKFNPQVDACIKFLE